MKILAVALLCFWLGHKWRKTPLDVYRETGRAVWCKRCQGWAQR